MKNPNLIWPLSILFLMHIIPSFGQAPSDRYKDIVIDPSYEHNKWGVEPSDMVYQFAAYISSYDSDDDNDGDGQGDIWGIPEWVAYEVKERNPQSTNPDYSRPRKWLTDELGNEKRIVPDDATYYVGGTTKMREVKTDYRYVRGHMCPKNAADRISLEAGYNTHSTLNAVPQLQWQNNGIWKRLEEDIEEWADKEGSIWVVCGPVFFGKSPAVWLGQKGEVQAAVPDALFKVVIKMAGNGAVETLSFLMPNVVPKAEDDYSHFLVSIDRLEELTGLDFLSNIDDPLADSIESKYEGLSDSERRGVVEKWFD